MASSRKFRDLSDIQLGQVIIADARGPSGTRTGISRRRSTTSRRSRNRWRWREQSLKDNRKRVEIGTLAPIDIVQAQAEVASNEERVIVAEALIKRAQDNLRALILDSSARRLLEHGASSRATRRRSRNRRSTSTRRCATPSTTGPDLLAAKNTLERSDLDIRYLRNQILPDVNAQVNYGAIGVGGVQLPGEIPSPASSRGDITTADRAQLTAPRSSDVFQQLVSATGPSASRSAIRSARARRRRTWRARGSNTSSRRPS